MTGSGQDGNATKINMRGWARITLGSSRLSNLGHMRKQMEKLFKPWPSTQECMWEITVRVPPGPKRLAR